MRAPDLIGGVRCVGCRRFGAPLCADCVPGLRRAGPPPLIAGAARVLSPFAYEGATRSLVLQLKLSHLRPMATPLVAGMTGEVWREGLAGDVVTWVPGRGRDILQRGFDHAGVLALGLSRRTGLRCIPLLARCGRRPDQASLGRGERLVNLRGAFRAGPCAGARVVLVDDLITTGATATACVEALGRAGASSIEVITACRA